MKKILRIIILVLIIFIIVYLINNKEIIFSNNSIINDNNASDTIKPSISLTKRSAILTVGTEYNYKDFVYAIDDIDGDITDNIKIEGSIDTSKLGKYIIKYIVTDNSGNTSEKEQEIEVRNKLENGLPVLMYHFFYSKDDPNYAGKTPDNNVLMIEKFREQMNYLKEENYYFPTWDEVEAYIDGKIELPEKSVVLTDDDGNHTFFALAVPVTEELQIPITSFVITSWYEERLDEKYEYVDYESHSDDMHKSGASGKGAMVNWNYNDIVNDLQSSKNKIENHTGEKCTVFCYPFGHYNDTAIKALTDTGYKLAFTVEGGRVKKGADKYKLPRVRINGNTSITEFKNSVK